MPGIKELSIKTKLLIYECKEKFPQLSAEFIADSLDLNIKSVKKLFKDGEIIIPSKINRQNGQTKNKVYRRERLLFRKWKSYLY